MPTASSGGRLGDRADRARGAVGLAGGAPDRTRRAPHAGAQLSFSNRDGHRFTCFLRDQAYAEIAALVLRHLRRAGVEDRIRCAKDTGIENFPFHRGDLL